MYLTGYEKTLHQAGSTAALQLAVTRQGGQPQPRSVPGIQHGFVQFRRRMEGTSSEGLFPKHVTEGFAV
jgi:hypothetical protein